jgi:hypothetical protein
MLVSSPSHQSKFPLLKHRRDNVQLNQSSERSSHRKDISDFNPKTASSSGTLKAMVVLKRKTSLQIPIKFCIFHKI